MKKQQVHEYVHYICLILIIFTLPFSILINSYFILLLGINWILTGEFKFKLQRLSTYKTAWILIGFYLLHFIGLGYTQDLDKGLLELEKKFSLFAFPLILSTSNPISKSRFQLLLKGFVLACSVGMVICLVFALIQFLKSGSINYFFYHQLGDPINIHAVYFALYLLFSLFIVVYFFVPLWKSLANFKRFIGLVWIIFSLLFVILLASKTILISVFLFSNVFALIHSSRLGRPIIGMLTILLINFSLFFLIKQFKPVKDRFNDSIHSNLNFIKEDKYSPVTPFTGISIRLAIWKFTTNLLTENRAWWLGVGTGEGQYLLDKTYKKKNMYQGVEGTTNTGYLGYNNHNQYFETLLELGIIGLIYLLIYFFMPAYLAFRRYNPLHLAFIFLFAISCLTESMLCTQKGTVFFALFQSLFLFQSRPELQIQSASDPTESIT